LTTSIIQSFLRLRLLDIGADDTRLAKLNEVSAELAATFVNEPVRATAIILVACDPAVTTDPALDEIAAVVEKHWPTYASAFAGVPVVLFRAIALEALSRAQEQQPAIATATALIARNVLPHLEGAKETEALSALFARASEIMTVNTNAAWSMGEELQAPDLGQLPQVDRTSKIDRKVLQGKVDSSVGPSNKAGQAGSSPNPHWSNSAPHWSYEFAERLGPILADIHDKAVENAVTARSKVDAALTEAVTGFMSNLSDWMAERSGALERRVSLLWWRESLYSSSAKASYRTLTPELAAVHMAVDFASHVPSEYPPSVEHFLREAVVAVVGEQRGRTERVRISSLVGEVSKTENISLKAALEGYGQIGHGRHLLVQAIADGCSGDAREEFKPDTTLGLPKDTSLCLGDLAVWLFRELEALDSLEHAELNKADEAEAGEERE
jgi:hypothetical protein